MTKCDKCGKEAGNLFCGHCREEIHNKHNLIPLLYWDKLAEGYRAGCSVVGCPANENGVCISVHKNLQSLTFHEYDGDNCIKQVCG